MRVDVETAERQLCWKCGERFNSRASSCPADGVDLLALSKKEDGDPQIGRVVSERFRIVGLLGEGGMGTVYRARQLDFNREVAIKLMKREDAGADYMRRFLAEAEIIANLQHPHVVRLYDFGRTKDAELYMVMELLDGRSLSERKSSGPLTYGEIFKWMLPVLEALAEAHSHGVVHRDLKPENVFLLDISSSRRVFPKLLDFGVAKQVDSDTFTQTGTVCGTPRYMSPEQITGNEITASSDIYSIGVILYELISGTAPFIETNYVKLATSHVAKAPVPLGERVRSIPKRLEQLVMTVLAKEPHDRPGSMNDVVVELERIRAECFDPRTLSLRPAARESDRAGYTNPTKPALGSLWDVETVRETGDFAAQTDDFPAAEVGGRLRADTVDVLRGGGQPSDVARQISPRVLERLRDGASVKELLDHQERETSGASQHTPRTKTAPLGYLRHPVTIAIIIMILAGATAVVLWA